MLLQDEGCDAGQGFYFSRPLEGADADGFLAAATVSVFDARQVAAP